MKPWSDSISFRQSLRNVLFPATAGPAETRAFRPESERLAYERGCQEAEAKWKVLWEQQQDELFRRQQRILNRLEQALPSAVAEIERDLVDLACEVARKLVAGLPVTKEMVEASIQEALSEVESQGGIEVFVNPADLELLKGMDSSLLRQEGQTARVTFQESSEIERGGCLVRTRFGTIDGRRETKYALLRRNLGT